MCLCARKPKVTCAPIDILQWFVISIRNASFKVKLKYRVLFFFFLEANIYLMQLNI